MTASYGTVVTSLLSFPLTVTNPFASSTLVSRWRFFPPSTTTVCALNTTGGNAAAPDGAAVSGASTTAGGGVTAVADGGTGGSAGGAGGATSAFRADRALGTVAAAAPFAPLVATATPVPVASVLPDASVEAEGLGVPSGGADVAGVSGAGGSATRSLG